MGARMLRKGLAVAVILLFIGVAFAPSINASALEDELVEFDVEFCGLGKKHTIKLTQEEADEVELLFDDIQDGLSDVESDDGAMVIFNEAIVVLDEYGLLGDLSVKQAQNFVEKANQYLKLMNKLEKTINKNLLGTANYENRLCFIIGVVKGISLGFIPRFLDTYGMVFYTNPIIITILFPLIIFTYFIGHFNPLPFGAEIHVIQGTLASIGIDGFDLALLGTDGTIYGYTGIKITFTPFRHFLLGFALSYDFS